MDMRLLYRAASLLWPDAPSARLARLADRPKSTARNWRRNRRRAPLDVYRRVRQELQARGAAIFSLMREFDREIPRREGDPPRRRGFFVVDPRTGQNRVNRRGRPRRA